ncbi:MAG: PTS sugar transporter subunit IIA [Lachnospiraceae bacterium]
MIGELLDIDRIELDVEAKDWKDALRKAGKILVENGSIEQEYVEKTILAVEELGPYIVIMPGVAFGHSRPDETVKETCMQMIRLKEPVEFGSQYNDPVKLIIMFASTDSKGHMNTLQQIAQMMMEPENVELLLKSENIDEIKKLLSSY